MKTEEDFKKAVEERNITEWRIHNCSLCGYPCGYVFNEGRVGYDSGCDCTGGSHLSSRSYWDVAHFYNTQTNPEYIAKMDEFWFSPTGVTKYLTIWETGDLLFRDETTEEDIQSCDDGYCTILKIDFDNRAVTRWNEAEWVNLEE